MDLHVTCLTAATLAVLLVLLSVPISLRRQKSGISLGHEGDDTLRNLSRAHGNFTEYAPLGLILVLLMELGGAPINYLYAVAGALVLGRIVHAAGMILASVPLRAIGTLATMFTLIAGAIGVIKYCGTAVV